MCPRCGAQWLVGEIEGATLADGIGGGLKLIGAEPMSSCHSGRNPDALLDVAVLIERMDESTQVGYAGSCSLSIFRPHG